MGLILRSYTISRNQRATANQRRFPEQAGKKTFFDLIYGYLYAMNCLFSKRRILKYQHVIKDEDLRLTIIVRLPSNYPMIQTKNHHFFVFCHFLSSAAKQTHIF